MRSADALVDEGLDDGLDRLEAVDGLAVFLVVLGEHGAGEVDGEDDVVALGADLAFVFDALGTGEGDDEQREAEEGEADGPARRGGERRAMPGGGERDEQHGHAAATAEPEDERQREEGEEPERVFEDEVAHARGRWSAESVRVES
jgi:hypothetical protein